MAFPEKCTLTIPIAVRVGYGTRWGAIRERRLHGRIWKIVNAGSKNAGTLMPALEPVYAATALTSGGDNAPTLPLPLGTTREQVALGVYRAVSVSASLRRCLPHVPC